MSGNFIYEFVPIAFEIPVYFSILHTNAYNTSTFDTVYSMY